MFETKICSKTNALQKYFLTIKKLLQSICISRQRRFDFVSFSSIKSIHLQQKINITNIELFLLNSKITTKYCFDDVINVNKKVYYRDIIFFV